MQDAPPTQPATVGPGGKHPSNNVGPQGLTPRSQSYYSWLSRVYYDDMPAAEGLPRVVLLPDEPIADYRDDKLDTARFAKVIASAAHHTETPFTIGVFGRWGEGKTSLLRQAKSLIAENYKDDITVWFNAWQYEREEVPIVPLILTIGEALEKTVTTRKSVEYLRKAGKALIAIARSINLKLSYFGSGIEISGKDLLEEIGQTKEGVPADILPISVYVRAFSELQRITTVYQKSGETSRIVVFIDDLDRCLPERSVGLLQGIKLVLNQPGFVFILGLDRQVLEGYLTKMYKTAGSGNPTEHGRRFIDKIIQLPLPIPRQDDLTRYIENLFERRELKYEENKPIVEVLKNIKQLITLGANANPRNVVRFINNLIVDRTLWILGGEKEELVDGKLLGIGAVARILREHLGDELYVAFSNDSEFCEDVAKGGVDRELLMLEKDRKRRKSDQLRVEITWRFDESPFLQDVLKSEFGKAWLNDHALRDKVDRFLREERGEEEGREDEPTPTNIVRQAIMDGKEIPLSEEELSKVGKVDLSFMDVDDAKLVHLEKLTNLNALYLSGTQITDAGLVHLEKLTNLNALDLHELERVGPVENSDHRCRACPPGKAHELERIVPNCYSDHRRRARPLGEAHELERVVPKWDPDHRRRARPPGKAHELERVGPTLYLSGTQITDAGLVHLEKLTNLNALYLNGTQITDAGLVHLEKLTNLNALDLNGTQITDAGLVHLEKLTNLNALALGRTQITDAGLVHLEKLTNLNALYLIATQITDAGLVHLEKLTNLNALYLNVTQITDAGLKGLRQRLPNTYVFK